MSLAMHHHHPEMRSDGEGMIEELLHLLRTSVSCDVIVVRLQPEEHIPDAASRVERLESSVAQTLHEMAGSGFQHRHKTNHSHASGRRKRADLARLGNSRWVFA